MGPGEFFNVTIQTVYGRSGQWCSQKFEKMSDAEGQCTVPTTHSGFGGGGREDMFYVLYMHSMQVIKPHQNIMN